MSCFKCKSDRVASIGSKSSDLNAYTIDGVERDGYVPHDLGIGGGDYVEFDWCLNCGTIQGDWPLPPHKLEGMKLDKSNVKWVEDTVDGMVPYFKVPVEIRFVNRDQVYFTSPAFVKFVGDEYDEDEGEAGVMKQSIPFDVKQGDKLYVWCNIESATKVEHLEFRDWEQA